MPNLAQEQLPAQGLVVPFPKKERLTMTGIDEGYTRLPNLLIDSEIMADLSDKAFKCLLFVLRQTFGFGRNSHTISITQFQKYCGIKKEETVTKAIRELELCNAIRVERKTGCLNEYFLTLNHYQQKGLPPTKGTTPNKWRGSTPVQKWGTTPIKGGAIKENIKEIFKENTHKENVSSVDEILSVWTPDLHSLNSWLLRSGEKAMTQEQVTEVLLEVNAYYEARIQSGQISNTQMYSNFVKWVKRQFTPKTQKTVPTQNNRNVNQAWGDIQHYAPATDDIDLGDLV